MKILVFYHQYLINNWKELIFDQFKTLYQSGLYNVADKVCCGVVGTQSCLDEYSTFIKELVASYTATNKIEIRTSIENNFEYITLNWLKEYCDVNDAYVLYFHTKGISQPIGSVRRPYEDDWLACMTYFNIEKWKDCIAKLEEGYNCCGICFHNSRKKWFFGNFWWANSNYIKKLTPVIALGKDLNKIKSVILKAAILRKNRFYYERWPFIYASKIPELKVFCFYNTDDFYSNRRHPPGIYRK